MPPVTMTVKSDAGLVVPSSIRRRAGIKAGDRLEFRASRGVITIVAKSGMANDEYTAAQRRAIDREIAKGLDDIRQGRVHGPFTPGEAARFLKAELRARTKSTKAR